MKLEIKMKARFAFLPKLIEIAKEDRINIPGMVEIGNSLGFERDLTENIERYLISENFLKPSQHGGILSRDGIGKVAMSSLGRVVTEIRSQTIFTIFDNEELKSALKKWARDNGCQITIGENIPDIVAIPFFACVIDRKVIGKEAWELYLEYRQVDGDDPDYVPLFKACIIVDGIRDIRDMKLPQFDPVFCFDLREKHSIQLVINSIEIAKNIVDNG